MKRKVALIIIVSILLAPSIAVNGDSTTFSFSWETGTKIDVTAVIDSNKIRSGYHVIDITVRLIDLNSNANDIYDIEVQIRIPGYFTSSIIYYDPIATTSNYQTKESSFYYDVDWGINWLQIIFECKEDISLAPDNELIGEYVNFFLLEPDTSTTPTTPPPSPPTEGWFNISEDWWMLVLGGVGLFGIGAIVAVVILRSRRV